MNKQGSSNDSSAYEENRNISSVQQTTPKTRPDTSLAEEKYFYGLFTQIASVLEASTKAIGRKKRLADRRHMSDRIKNAPTWDERDRVLRDLAAFCFETSKKFAAQGNPDMQLKWFKLLERFLRVNGEDYIFDKQLADIEAELKARDDAKKARPSSGVS